MGYKKKAVWEVTCETCGKVEETKRQENGYYGYRNTNNAPSSLPKGWVDVTMTKTPARGQGADPPVCSEDCLVTYVKKRYAELMKPRKAPAKKKSSAKKTTARKSTRRRTTRGRY